MAVVASILIDTNIIINLEDNKEIGKPYADLSRICNQFGITLYSHEASRDDVERDKDPARKRISLSKLVKYPCIRRTPAPKADKERKFGLIRSENDDVDTDLLVSLDLNIADLLVTNDRALINRVSGTSLATRVLTLPDTVTRLQSLYGSLSADFTHVQDRTCNQFDPNDPFFKSLEADYPEFRKWYHNCMSKQRPCWVIMQQSGIGGMIIYKPEHRSMAKDAQELGQLGVTGDKVLKLCLFKVDQNISGEKFGEQLLKKGMDYAHRNSFDSIYLTAFPKHQTLISLLGKFGFEKCGTKGSEDVYFKRSKVLRLDPHPAGFEFHKTFWPCISIGTSSIYLVPVQRQFHDRLFPEAARRYASSQMTLFEDALPKTPGNAIRKAYVCNAPTLNLEPGSILLFYRSTDSEITSIGVLEQYSAANDLIELQSLVGNRSVYTGQELASKVGGRIKAKAMNFYYAKDLKNPVPLSALRALQIAQPQSIAQLDGKKFLRLLSQFDPEDRHLFHA
jgi:hypothetical protein